MCAGVRLCRWACVDIAGATAAARGGCSMSIRRYVRTVPGGRTRQPVVFAGRAWGPTQRSAHLVGRRVTARCLSFDASEWAICVRLERVAAKGLSYMPGLRSSHGGPTAASKAAQRAATARTAVRLRLFSSTRSPVPQHPMSRGAIEFAESVECVALPSTGSSRGSSGAAG